jgi:hypothetical protein
MLLVQKFLETQMFADLAREHGVYASFSKSGHKFSLNYDQIEAKEADPLSQECRGLILSAEDGHVFTAQISAEGRPKYDHICPGKTIILAYPMRRFFNMGQGCAAEINWSDPNLAVLEKLDGTLCIVYYDPFTNQWCVATRSVPEADLLMDNGLFTFRTLFEKAVQDTCGYDFHTLTKSMSPYYTYCFELCTPYNRIVVDYKTNNITLLAVRHLATFQELEFNNPLIEKLANNGVPLVQAHTYTSIDELVDWVATLNPMKHEGIVVRDRHFNRIKIKNAAYCAANKLRDTLGSSPRNCLELILLGKEDDAMSFLPPDIADNLILIKEKYRIWLEEQERMYKKVFEEASVINAGDKKTFALTLNKYTTAFKPAYFTIFSGKAISVKDFIEKNRKDGSWSDSFLDKILSVI